ncbi:MAG: hypothetical protein D6732_23315 [Methanobacteriota archaeon]|nr:MAG: hypothetical protein D6732_23315 [Euryarchaeota archaeon]
MKIFIKRIVIACSFLVFMASSATATDLTNVPGPVWRFDGTNRLVYMASQIVYNGSWISKPLCLTGGTPRIYIIPVVWRSRGLVNQWYSFTATSINFRWWKAKLVIRDGRWAGTGGNISGYAYMGIAMLYCLY